MRCICHVVHPDSDLRDLYDFFMHSLQGLYVDSCAMVDTAQIGREKDRGEFVMEDVLWIAVTIAFFALSIGYVHFCDRVK